MVCVRSYVFSLSAKPIVDHSIVVSIFHHDLLAKQKLAIELSLFNLLVHKCIPGEVSLNAYLNGWNPGLTADNVVLIVLVFGVRVAEVDC